MSKFSKFYLPEDVLVLVFKRLPAKSVGRCSCVCRSWKVLISRSEFIRFHLEYQSSIQKKVHGYLLSEREFETYLAEYSINSERDSENSEVGLEIQPLYNPNHQSNVAEGKMLQLVGSCNGLICQILFIYGISVDCSIYGEYVISLCNPITKSIWVLPESPSYLKDEIRRRRVVFYGFGYDDLHDTYKVFLATAPPLSDYDYVFQCLGPISDAKYKYEIYSLRSNKWMMVTGVHDFNDYHIHGPRWNIYGVLINRALHWIIKKPYRPDDDKNNKMFYILAFDLIVDRLSILAPLPDSTENELQDSLKLSVMNGCLLLTSQSVCLKLDDIVDMWVMKEYGSKDSWTRIRVHNSPYNLYDASLVALLVEDNISYRKGKLIYHDTLPSHTEEMILLSYDVQSNQAVELPPPQQSEHTFHHPKQVHFVASLVQPHPPSFVDSLS